MSTTATTPPDGTPQPSGLARAVVRLADGQDALGDAVGEMAREVHEIGVELSAAVGTFAESHGHRGAEAKHVGQQLDLLVGQGRAILERLGRIESRMAGAEMVVDDLRSRLEAVEALSILQPIPTQRGPNGSGHDGE